MTFQILLVAHIAVLGYWLGSELCINSEYRFIAFRDDLDFAARDAMTGHLMDVDQHVRYALILQLALGTMLALHLGYLPGGTTAMWAAAATGVGWIVFVEFVHRLRETPTGARLAAIDRGLRYAVMAALLALALGIAADAPWWLRIKLACFAGLIACGIAIRLVLIGHFRLWAAMRRDGPSAAGNAEVKRIYVRATSILGLLWAFIAAIAALAVFKPGT